MYAQDPNTADDSITQPTLPQNTTPLNTVPQDINNTPTVDVPISPSVPSVSQDNSPVVPESLPKKSFKKYLIIVGVILILAVITIFSLRFLRMKRLESDYSSDTYYEDYDDYDDYEDYDDYDDYYITEVREPESTFVNQKEVSLSQVQGLIEKYGEYTGAIDVSTMKFDYVENHKGIKIAWTNSKPISAERLQWLKDIIDTLPASFLEKYPIGGFYNVDDKNITPENAAFISTAAAFASGQNIFLNPIMANEYLPNIYVQYSKSEFANVIYHEWAHVIQFYDIFYTFTEGYLDYNFKQGYLIGYLFFQSANILYDFGNRTGWVYEYTDINECYEDGFCIDGYSYCPRYYGNKATKPTEPDPEFLKTTEYALESYFTSGPIEDMAETFGYFVTCDKSVVFSRERTHWAEEFLGNSQEYYCNNSRF